MDRQEAELRAQLQGTGVSVTRSGDQIILNMPPNITFATDQDSVKAGFYRPQFVALVIKKFNQTTVDVYGHTDAQGQRQLQLRPVPASRAGGGRLPVQPGHRLAPLRCTGFGESRPIASNNTEDGRAQNRRVEIPAFTSDRGLILPRAKIGIIFLE